MRAKRINEFGGAGFSYSGATLSTSRPGGINRGGFSGANNIGGQNMMYTYEIKPLNRELQPEANDLVGEERISKGNDISGYELNKKDGQLHVGPVLDTVMAEDGSLMYYVIMDPNTAQQMKIDPTTALLISKMDGVDPLGTKLSREEESLVNPGNKAADKMKQNENMQAKLIKESTLSYNEFIEEIISVMNERGIQQEQIDDSLDYFHSKGYLEDYWREGYTPSEAYAEIREMKYYK